jgi:DNA-binding response OmpR family regulator
MAAMTLSPARTVLVIEDSPTESAMVSDCLRQAGYHVLAAVSGIAAKECIATNEIDVIILDLILPDMNGYDLYRTLQLDARTNQIPIVILTQRDSVPEEYYGRMLGAAAYLKKPFRPSALLEEIRRLAPLP